MVEKSSGGNASPLPRSGESPPRHKLDQRESTPYVCSTTNAALFAGRLQLKDPCAVPDNTEDKIQCHFISNTHWDREWRYSAQRTRHMLVYLVDMLLDIFEKEPRFSHFHMDSQTVPLLDYLEVRPEKEAVLRKHVTEGRLAVGPWFCLPDEFMVGGESLIRNLQLGHKIAAKFGQVSKTGYSPFSWGQISQMPQIYKGFGIDMISFYRGINTLVSPKSEFVWEGPDGTRIYASRMSIRPRYNVWYVIQRPVFWNEQNEGNRYMQWKRGHGPFRFADEANADLDYQYLHPGYQYLAGNVPQRAAQAIREQDPDWTTPHRFWSSGHDSSCPDIREGQMIEDCNKALSEAEVFHSSVKAWQDGVIAGRQAEWPVLHGEMRHLCTKGSASTLMPWVTSSRTYIKQNNFRAERALTSYAEPAAVFASLLGAPWPQGFVDQAYYWLLLNHGHDSIAGCGRDVLADDVLYRLRQSREISSCVLERAMMDIVGSIDLSDWSPEEMALTVYNPAPFERSEVIAAIIDIPLEWKCQGFEILDMQGEKAALQVCAGVPFTQAIQSPNDTANLLPATRFTVRAEFQAVPGFGYRTFKVKPLFWPRPHFDQPKTMLAGPQTMENEFLSVTINANGTLDIADKQTGRMHAGLGYFRDSSEKGDPWIRSSVPNESVFTTLNERAEVSLVRDGELEASFQVRIDWRLPENITLDQHSRSHVMRPYPIVNTVTLRKGQPWVDVVTEVDNTVENHYLQVSFPTGVRADTVMAQGQFDVVARPIATPDYTLFEEEPSTEQPMNSFVDISDGTTGFALLNEGLKGYQAHDDRDRTLSISLLRGYQLKMCVTEKGFVDYSQSDKGSQCLGKHSFHYAITPHAGDWAKAGLWQMAERFNLAFMAGQVGPTKHGTEPLTKSFLELTARELHVSAVKRSEGCAGWIVRLFNPMGKTIPAAIRLNAGHSGPATSQSPVERVQAEFALPTEKVKRWKSVRQVTLEEIPERDLDIDADGWTKFEITPKKILTLEFLP